MNTKTHQVEIDENSMYNSLWIGKELSALELLTILSFVDKKIHFRLWLYDSLNTFLPKDVEICDANEILPASSVFSYNNSNQYGHGKGSFAGFSDIFRYKLLYERGGWWVDMDVTCLRQFDFHEPYYFRKHDKFLAVGNIMKCPAHSDLMLRCYEESLKTVDQNNLDWDKPIIILNKYIVELGLKKYIYGEQSNEDKWEKTSTYILTSKNPPSDWYFIHWQNEEWRQKNISKKSFYWKSYLARTLAKYELFKMPLSIGEKLKNSRFYLKHIFLYYLAGFKFLNRSNYFY